MQEKREWAEGWSDVEGLREAVFRHLSFLCRDASEADDLTQETLMRAASRRAQMIEPERLRAWTLRIAENLFRDRKRQEGRLRRVEDSMPWLESLEDGESAEEDVAMFRIEDEWLGREEALELLERAWGRLRAGDRELIEAYYAEDGGSRSAARRCGMRRELVKIRLFRARARLERALLLEFRIGRRPSFALET